MNLAKVIEIQRAERAEILEDILTSGERRKMIIAGPGTGKTHTFTKLLERLGGENNLATTFTNKLVSELAQKLSTHAQVHTLHAYCRSALGKQRLHLELSPLLTEVVSSDADLLRKSLSQFDARFQNLDDTAPEIEFYLTRSAYYGVGSFHDMVYRLYKLLHNEQLVVPEFDHIVVDEFQDFNKLEVALIDELEKRVKSGGSVLIVGDDDQSIYSDRFASPHYLRTKYLSGIYKQFRLPFCTRCTEVIVEAVRTLRQKALEFGLLTGSVDKRFECYYEEKQADNLRYQNIIEANCTTKAVLCRYIHSEIDAIT
ncbi:MAG: UvrD-helicase domain-containing protein, partial [Candidatus Doudnabacteria bacterium]|nr:UvrD-helicase domain-containing protein [Candidatus Doudnabacteria bacterium]